MTHRTSFLSAIILTTMLFGAPAYAKDPAPVPTKPDLMPAASPDAAAAAPNAAGMEGETHPVLRVTPDKSELVPLDREAASVIIGNPEHISVLLDSPKLAVVIPRSNGATYFTILDREGKVIMQRHVVVGSPKKNYVRVRRSCNNVPQGTPCQPTSVYFCPDMCHEVGTGGGEDAGASASVPTTSPQ